MEALVRGNFVMRVGENLTRKIRRTTVVEIPDGVTVEAGYVYEDGVFSPPPAPKREAVSPIRFKMLFTSAERVALKKHVDPTVQDFMELVNDPRLDVVDLDMTSVQDGINYCMMVLAQDGVITDAAARVEEILSNVAK